jgi:hypothetical protein
MISHALYKADIFVWTSLVFITHRFICETLCYNNDDKTPEYHTIFLFYLNVKLYINYI